MTVVEVAVAVRSFRFTFKSEDELQQQIAEALTNRGFRVSREVLVEGGRIDMLVETGIGLEVKVSGAPSLVQAQVERYLRGSDLIGLVLVTASVRHQLPPTLNGKPCITVSLAGSGL